MNLNDSQIAGIARRYLDDSLCNLAPDAAPTPFMVAGGPHGNRHIGLHSLNDPDFPETARTVIPAFIVLDEAIEVALVAFLPAPDIDRDVCEQSQECALIAHWGPHGRDLFTAAVTRRNTQPPVIGGFRKGPVSASLGPIDDGVRSGLDMTKRMWNSDADQLRQRIDDIRSAAATSDTQVLPRTVNTLREWGWLD